VGDPVPFLISFLLGLVLTPITRWVGLAIGVVDRPGGDVLKIHREPIPLLGGVAVISGAAAAQALWGGGLPWAVVAAAGLALAVGLLDDVRPIAPIVRVGLLAGVASILVIGGTGFDRFGAVGGVGLILLVLACANAVNITDGQDGLAGGVAAISSLGLAATLALYGADGAASLGLALAGALTAFLVWNRPPARVFLGDGGAYAVGTLLAFLAARVVEMGGLRGFMAAGAALGVLAFEVGFSVGRRVAAGERLAGGDRLHSYDLLTARWGRTGSTLAFWALAVSCAGGAVVVSSLPAAAGASLLGAGLGLGTWWGVWLWRRRPHPAGGGESARDVSSGTSSQDRGHRISGA
jgi:UDP-GlcNAc:undecaprenyl-phosphate/decaprenyl-phosphate GlcNAc-1-phosphate transferase